MSIELAEYGDCCRSHVASVISVWGREEVSPVMIGGGVFWGMVSSGFNAGAIARSGRNDEVPPWPVDFIG